MKRANPRVLCHSSDEKLDDLDYRDMTQQSSVQILQSIFRGRPEKHIQLRSPTNVSRKDIVEVKRGAAERDYAAHLRPEASQGPGGIGLYPGFVWGRRTGLWTNWAMLDFDDHSPDDLQLFFEVLTRQGLQVLANQGTRGRGAHLWFLLERPVPLEKAAASLHFLQHAAAKLGISKVERRPHHNSGDLAVMLPYRGAGVDGRGFNPLIDYATGEVIELPYLLQRERQDTQLFSRLGRLRSTERFIEGTYRPKPPLSPRVATVIGEGEHSDRWATELSRLPLLWQEGRRHWLVLGAASHGLNCGVSPATIESDLMSLVERCGDEEPEERRKAIRTTLERHKRGQPVSASYFYEQANVEPPTKVSDEVRATLGALWEEAMSDAWQTQAGKSARSLYKALLRLAFHHGQRNPHGIEVSVSWGQLQQEADLGSSATLRNSLLFLEEKQLLRRGAQAEGEKSGSFVLLVTERSTLIRERGLRECFSLSRNFRNGEGRLGKTAEQLFDLLNYFGPQDLNELANRMKTRPTDLRKQRDKLLDAGLILEDEKNLLHVAPDSDRALGVQEEYDGTLQARERQRQKQRIRQDRYRAHLKSKVSAPRTTLVEDCSEIPDLS